MKRIDISTDDQKRLKSTDVRIVYLFGSYAERTEHNLSDIDIGIVFNDIKIVENNTNSVYQNLYDLFTEYFKNKRLDIVFLQRADLELCFDVIRHGQVIYEDSVENRLNFEESVFQKYLDFKPILNQFDRAVLERSAND